MHVPSPSPRLTGVLTALLAAALVAVGVSAVPAGGAPSTDALRTQIDRQGAQADRLASDADRLAGLEQAASRAVSLLQGRLDAKEQDLSVLQAKLAETERRLRAQRQRLRRLEARLAHSRAVLSRLLREQYMADKPDLVGVVLNSHGFSQLIERVDFLKKVQSRDAAVIDTVRTARVDADRQARALAGVLPRQRAATAAVQRQRDALSSIGAALEARRATLAQAHDARVSALQNTRASRSRAKRTLTKLEAEQAQAAADMAGPTGGGSTGPVAQSGPGGPWAIPWAIVQCESGGQNLPPNSATASGYYQFIDATWAAMGGSTHSAYQASKAEQDRLAAKLWAGGSGARNWDCASIVGII